MGSNGLEYRQSYGRSLNEGTGYLIVPPAGQWPRNNYNSDLDRQLAYYSVHNGYTMYEIGFSVIQTNGEHFSLKTYGLGDVNGRNPSDYADNYQKKLLDSLQYKKSSEKKL